MGRGELIVQRACDFFAMYSIYTFGPQSSFVIATSKDVLLSADDPEELEAFVLKAGQ
jgi:hypothetical protein